MFEGSVCEAYGWWRLEVAAAASLLLVPLVIVVGELERQDLLRWPESEREKLGGGGDRREFALASNP